MSIMDKAQSQIEFCPLQAVHARPIAKLHIEGINEGFISSLAIDFLTALYEAKDWGVKRRH